VVKVFPNGIVAEGPRRVNGKSVPFAHLGKRSGFPEQRFGRNKLFHATYTCNHIIIHSLFALLAAVCGIPDA